MAIESKIEITVELYVKGDKSNITKKQIIDYLGFKRTKSYELKDFKVLDVKKLETTKKTSLRFMNDICKAISSKFEEKGFTKINAKKYESLSNKNKEFAYYTSGDITYAYATFYIGQLYRVYLNYSLNKNFSYKIIVKSYNGLTSIEDTISEGRIDLSDPKFFDKLMDVFDKCN